MKEIKSELKRFAKSSSRIITDLINKQLSKVDITESNFSQDLIIKQCKEKGLTSNFEFSITYNRFIKSVANCWFSRLIILKALEANKIDQSLSSLDNVELDSKTLKLFLKNLNYISANLFNPNDFSNLVFPINNELIECIQSLPDEPFKSDHIIETLSTLYENFNSDYRTLVYKDLRNRIKIDSSTLPAVTQLFTPSYIVKYLVQNSIGRLWFNHLIAQEDFLEEDLINKFELDYYIPTQFNLEGYSSSTIQYFKNLTIEDLTILDPALGTGCILSYTFDLLLKFYKDKGYKDSEAVIKILENNLYGFEVDNDVFRINEIGLKLKAYKYNKNIFSNKIDLNFYCFNDFELDFTFIKENFGKSMTSKERTKSLKQLKQLLNDYKEAKLIGSLIIPGSYNLELIKKFISDKVSNDKKLNTISEEVDRLVKITELLIKKYDIVITNPPYFSNRNFNSYLKTYLKKYYKHNSKDLYTAFIERCLNFTKNSSYCGMLTMNSWLFLKYNKHLREIVLNNTIVNMIHLGTKAFGDIGGEVVQTVAFIIQKESVKNFRGSYLRLLEVQDKAEGIKDKVNLSLMDSNKFRFIPEFPIAYWANDQIIDHFKNDIKLKELADSKQGLATTDNNQFLRQWTEVDFNQINFDAHSTDEAKESGSRWFPYNKGGSFRKWYGNDQFIVDYLNDGFEIKHNVLEKYPYLKNPGFVVKNTHYYFKPSITWSLINTGIPSFRLKDSGYIFDVAGMSIFTDSNQLYLLGFLNSIVAQKFLEIIAPTINYQCGDIAQVPIIIDENKRNEIEALVLDCITLSKEDWDENELSWNFKKSPLIIPGLSLKEAVNNLKVKQNSRFKRLKDNEERLNELFLKIYNLDEVYSKDIEEKNISVNQQTSQEILKDFLSYFIGVLFGRYSLSTNGLILTDSLDDLTNYENFRPVIKNFIPFTDSKIGENLINSLKDFIKVVFPTDNVDEDLEFIAQTINFNSTNDSHEIIIEYFDKQFFHDHLKKYFGRPIYLQVLNPLKNIPNGLLYYHRFNESNLNPIIEFYEREIKIVQDKLKLLKNKKGTKTEQKRLKSNLLNLNKILNNLRSLNTSEINFDDGVNFNLERIQTSLDGRHINIFRKK